MRRRRGVAAAVALAALLGAGGCWPQVGHGPENQRWNPGETGLTSANVATLSPAWSVDLGTLASEPIVWGGKVYVSSVESDHATVTAMDPAAGTVLWRHPIVAPYTAGPVGPSAPVVAGGNLVVTSQFHLVVGPGDPAGAAGASASAEAGPGPFCGAGPTLLDPATGEERPGEAFLPGAAAPGQLVPFGNRVAAVGTSYERYCVWADPTLWVWEASPTGGTLRWSAPVNDPWPPDHYYPYAGPAVAGDQLFLTEDYRLVAYDVDGCGAPTCEPAWAFDLPAGDTYVPPVVGGNLVFVSTVGFYPDTSQLFAVDRATGQLAWRAPVDTSGADAVAYADGIVYVVDGAALRAFDAAGCGAPTCQPLWTAPLWTRPYAGSPNRIAVAGGVVYVGTSFLGRGFLRAFDASGCGASSCGERWSTAVDGTPQAMSVAASKLFVTVERGPAYTGAPNAVLAYAPTGSSP
jgi:outer membrane protein assembly factor BamB